MKADFLYASVNANIIRKNKRQKKAHFTDKSLKIRGIKYINVETRFVVWPSQSKILAPRLPATSHNFLWIFCNDSAAMLSSISALCPGQIFLSEKNT